MKVDVGTSNRLIQFDEEPGTSPQQREVSLLKCKIAKPREVDIQCLIDEKTWVFRIFEDFLSPGAVSSIMIQVPDRKASDPHGPGTGWILVPMPETYRGYYKNIRFRLWLGQLLGGLPSSPGPTTCLLFDLGAGPSALLGFGFASVMKITVWDTKDRERLQVRYRPDWLYGTPHHSHKNNKKQFPRRNNT